MFYAVDRYDISFTIREHLNNGEIVILDRYTDSNAGHQGSKIEDQNKRNEYLNWLYDLEFGILNLPKPDLVCILRVPAEVSFRLIEHKVQRTYIENGGKRDEPETNLAHQQRSEETYIWLSQAHPENHILIDCADSGNLFPPEVIHNLVYQILLHKRIL